MGTKNRERRRAKQAKRQRQQRAGGHFNQAGSGRSQSRDIGNSSIDWALVTAARIDNGTEAGRAERRRIIDSLVGDGVSPARQRLVVTRLVLLITADLGWALRSGWRAEDVIQSLRRRAGATAAAIVVVPLVKATQFGGRSHDGTDELVELAGGALELDPASRGFLAHLAAGIEAFSLLERLPRLADLGDRAATTTRRRSDHEERLLARIRGLLSKAESSEFPDEADAFMAKAQELMTGHCIDVALLEEADVRQDRSQVEARRVWLDDPYLQAKGLLLAEVGQANRCRTVLSIKLGFATIVGYRADLDATELLFTSLLVQATGRLTMLGRGSDPRTRARRPGFRRSFLVAYATRIGTRLRAASAAATTEADTSHEHRLLPVLARREREVSETVDRLFGELDYVDHTATDAAGWAAGTAAADLADLAVQDTLPFAGSDVLAS